MFKILLQKCYHYNDALEKHEGNDHIYPTPPLGQDMTQGQFLRTLRLQNNMPANLSCQIVKCLLFPCGRPYLVIGTYKSLAC